MESEIACPYLQVLLLFLKDSEGALREVGQGEVAVGGEER